MTARQARLHGLVAVVTGVCAGLAIGGYGVWCLWGVVDAVARLAMMVP